MIDEHDYDSPESLRVIRLFRNADFDPITGTMMALSVIGGGMSAAGTLAGGASAAAMGQLQQKEAQYQATQDTMNSAAAIAQSSAKSQDMLMRANLTRSSAVAGAAFGGVETTGGSAVENEAQIAGRGRYAAALEMWNGQNEATGFLNKAAAEQYSGLVDQIGGQMQQRASEFSAAGTLISSGASAYKMYGMNNQAPGAGASIGNSTGSPVSYD